MVSARNVDTSLPLWSGTSGASAGSTAGTVRSTALSLRRLTRLGRGGIVKEAVLRVRHGHCPTFLAIALDLLARAIGVGYFKLRLHSTFLMPAGQFQQQPTKSPIHCQVHRACSAKIAIDHFLSMRTIKLSCVPSQNCQCSHLLGSYAHLSLDTKLLLFTRGHFETLLFSNLDQPHSRTKSSIGRRKYSR